MSKIDDACKMLKDVGFSKRITRKNMAARFILAATQITEESDWQSATNNGIQIHKALKFLNYNYDLNFKENTRESLRKQGPKKLKTAGLAKDNVDKGIPTNSSKRKWYLSEDFFEVIKSFGTSNYLKNISKFKSHHKSRIEMIQDKREKVMLPVNYNGFKFELTPGPHNKLHKEILEKFAPVFAGDSELLYVGDTEKKI